MKHNIANVFVFCSPFNCDQFGANHVKRTRSYRVKQKQSTKTWISVQFKIQQDASNRQRPIHPTCQTPVFKHRSGYDQEVPSLATQTIQRHYHVPLISSFHPTAQNSDPAPFKPIIISLTKWACFVMRREATKGFQSQKGQLLCMNKEHAAIPFQAAICHKRHNACCSCVEFSPQKGPV